MGTYTRDQMDIMKFFAMVFGPTDGGYVELRPTNFAGSPDMDQRRWIPAGIENQEQFADAALELKDSYHVYFGVATRTKEGKKKGKGTSRYLKEITCLWADLDGDDYEGGKAEALERTEEFRLPPSLIIDSGHGYHSYWLLDKPYKLDEGHSKPKALLKALQIKELEADPTYDLTRVLRVLNTTNIKNPEKLVLAQPVKMEDIRYSFDELEEKLPWEEVMEEDYDQVEEQEGLVEEEYEGLEKVVSSDFIQHCREEATELPEPLWYAMITNLIPFKGGREKIHDLSRPYPDYSREETEAKIAHAIRDAPGPHTVEYIREHGYVPEDCEKIGVKSPAALAFVETSGEKGPKRGRSTTTQVS
ncbi:hypothetical protein KGY71_01845 [Candidatus Bipolaricaulota bacterium]|nr:hypothetical protein [Candidatus Bipolaricaulota bacterium]